ncbi:MAG: O-antigen ligase family protein [Acidimicrobiales bacterium]
MHRLHFLTQLAAHPNPANVAELLALGLVVVAACYLVSRIDVSVILVAALVLQLFSGNWGLMGIPIPLDRVAFIVALVALALKGARRVSRRKLVLRPLHVALLGAATWCAVSGILAGTLVGHLGFFAYLDRFGIDPFLVFCLAPLFFGAPRQRKILLVGLIGIGLYLGWTGLMEGAHLYRFIFPRYIADPNVGIQFGRARGPILESTGDGFCTFTGAVAAAIGLHYWSSGWKRWVCYATMVLDVVTLFFTLTRSVWLGGFIAIVGVMLMARRTRRMLVPLLLVGAVSLTATLALAPHLRSRAVGRTESQSPVWDRQNTDLAALRIIQEKPLTGVGWENFVNVSSNYMVQQPGYPITGVGIEVHNVFLSHAAELGVPGLALWLLGFLGAVRRGLWARRLPDGSDPYADPRDAELAVWRKGGLALLLFFLVVADLAPFSQALPNTLLWLWLGVLAAPYTSRFRALPATVARVSAKAPLPTRVMVGAAPTPLRPASL